MARRPRITQKEVAARANVSQTLVSLVLSGATIDVAESTRKQILDAAAELGYQGKARARVAPRQRLLAYIRPVVDRGHHEESWIYDAYDQYYDRIQNLLLEAAYREGYSLTVRPYKEEHELTQWLSEWGVDGVIWHGSGSLVEWIAERYPTAQLWRDGTVKADAVSANQRETVMLAMDYLRRHGHTRVLLLQAAPSYSILQRDRAKAYDEYVAEHHLPHWKDFLPKQVEARLEEGCIAISEIPELVMGLLESSEAERPTAIITGDHSALYIIKYLAAHGYQVPDAISIVGVDNIAASALIHPGLTSLDNQLKDVCDTVVSLLISRIRNPEMAYRKISITPQLIERESVAFLRPAPVEDGKLSLTASRKGFSLLQLVLSVLIIFILAGMLIPGVKTSMQKARQSRCIGNLRAIGSALSTYIADHNGNVPAPYIAVNRTALPSDPPYDERLWTVRMVRFGYLSSPDVLYCPTESPKNFKEADQLTNMVADEYHRRPLMRTYGMRQWWFGNDFVKMASDPKKMTLIESPAEFYIIADSWWTEWGLQGYNLQPGSAVQRIHLRHEGKANLLFLDGHVAPKGREYFATLHENEHQGRYSGGDESRNRLGHPYYTYPSEP